MRGIMFVKDAKMFKIYKTKEGIMKRMTERGRPVFPQMWIDGIHLHRSAMINVSYLHSDQLYFPSQLTLFSPVQVSSLWSEMCDKCAKEKAWRIDWANNAVG